MLGKWTVIYFCVLSERSYICVLGVLNLPLSTIFIFRFGIVPNFSLAIKCSSILNLPHFSFCSYIPAFFQLEAGAPISDGYILYILLKNKMWTFTFSAISKDIPISITTIYFGGFMGLFLTTGLLHLPEFYCLFQGFWFLLYLPSVYIILIIYSICNITDRSWGKI